MKLSKTILFFALATVSVAGKESLQHHLRGDIDNDETAAFGRFLAKPDDDSSDSQGNGTPDEMPPALESVCDLYTGKAKGLCNAFCEAQDCGEESSEDEGDGKKSCEQLRKKFTEETGESRFPCEKSRCPCWDNAEDLFKDRPILGQAFENLDKVYDDFALFKYFIGTAGDNDSSPGIKAREWSQLSKGYDCSYFDRPNNVNLRIDIGDVEVYQQCLRDIVRLAKYAHQLIPGSAETACRLLEVSDPSTKCPCWDGRPGFPEIVEVGEEGTTEVVAEKLGRDSKTAEYRANWDLGPRRYIAGHGRCFTDRVFSPILSPDQYNTCYNDIYQKSYGRFENPCHWYS